MQVQPYLFFDGRTEEALDFYKKAIGAEVTLLMRFNEAPDPTPPGMLPPGFENKVMHAELAIDDAIVMASDGMSAEPATFKGISLSLQARDSDEARRRFDALSDGGSVDMPLGKTFFSPSFGMLTDRFGIKWMVVVESKDWAEQLQAKSA
jgi:PhnB protein